MKPRHFIKHLRERCIYALPSNVEKHMQFGRYQALNEIISYIDIYLLHNPKDEKNDL